MTQLQTALDERDLAVAPAEGEASPLGPVEGWRRGGGARRTVAWLSEIALTLGAVFGVAVAGITVVAARGVCNLWWSAPAPWNPPSIRAR